MKRFILLIIACSVGVVMSAANANAYTGVELKFFGAVDDGSMLQVDAFSPRLAVRLALTDQQRIEIADILSDCHDRVVVIRRDHPRDFDRLVRVRYIDADKRIYTVLTPVQIRLYKRYRPDVHQWIHEQREWKEAERHDVRMARRDERREQPHHWDSER